MRIALTHAYSWPEVRRGAERIIRELSLALAGRGHEVTVLTAGGEPRTSDEGGVTTVRLRRMFANRARHERDFGLRLVRHLVAGFDVVHSFGPRDCVAAIRAARARRGMRTVYTNLGLPIRRWWDRHPDRRAHERVVRDVNVYGCMSRYALDLLHEEYGRTGVLTPGGVNLERFVPAASREPHPTILFSGALVEPHKGVRPLAEAVALLAPRYPSLRLWLSGPGDPQPLLASVPDDARTRTDVLPLGAPDEQGDRYGRAWVTALPSMGDSFGMVVVESLACGTPVVVSTHAALPELVEDGVTGALCQPLDAASIADALDRVLPLAQLQQTAAACRRSAEAYDWRTAIAPLMERLYGGP